jgi:nitrite reductase/ring-hydroxylating ferredoxin subunit
MGNFFKICDLKEIKKSKPQIFIVNRKKIAVYFNGKNYFAFNPVCPHANANLKLGKYKDKTVTCHWHNWEFDLQTGEGLNNQGQLKIYKTKIEGNNLFVQLEEPKPIDKNNCFPDIKWK